jgi:uncharacterized protein
MTKMYSISRGDVLFIVLVMLLVGFALGAAFAPEKIVSGENAKAPVKVEGERVVEMGIPAIDMEGNGVIAKLITTIRPGTGQVLVNINDVFAQFDTQLSGRSAARAVSNVTLADLSSVDIIYDIKVNASIVEGPSAGASMAASIFLALNNIKSADDVMMTGTISDDGSIGQVGSVKEKAGIAKKEGARLLLVPENQSMEETSTRIKTCKQVDAVEVCNIKYQYGNMNIGSSLNLTVVEVRTLEDVIKIYTKGVPTSS